MTETVSSAFGGCSNLTVELEDGMVEIKSHFLRDSSGVVSVIIPDSVKSIGAYAFPYCRDLTNIIYKGTSTQWNDVNKIEFWDNETGSYTIYCQGDKKAITKAGEVYTYET